MLAVFDLEFQQPSYLITTFLMQAERLRRQCGDEDLYITFNPGTSGPPGFGRFKHWPNTEEELQQNMDGIAKPMCWFLPNTRVVDIPKKRMEFFQDTFVWKNELCMDWLMDGLKEGLRPFRCRSPIEKDPKLVTITLRECGDRHWIIRDSNVREWIKVAKALMGKGWDVKIIRDTRVAEENIPGCVIAPQASRNLYKRGELYSKARCNMLIGNGPVWFSIMLDANTIMFKPTTEGAGKSHSEASLATWGMFKGQQYAGAPIHQQLVWEEDRYEVIMEAFNAYVQATS